MQLKKKEERLKELEEEYLSSLIIEFLNSYFYEEDIVDEKNIDIEKIFSKRKNYKSYIAFLIQKEKDYNILLEYMRTLEYSYEYSLGRILELNSGHHNNFIERTIEDDFNVTLISPYAELLGFNDLVESDKLYNGSLETLKSLKQKVVKKEECYLKFEGIRNNLKSLSDFDTILNINPNNLSDIESVYLYAKKYKKNCFSGYITNRYDILSDEKIKNIEDLVLKFNKKEEEVELLEAETEGSIVKVLTYFKGD